MRYTALYAWRLPGMRLLGLLAFLAAAAPASPCWAAEGAPRRPNLVVILVDDFGYGDLSLHGCRDIATPHIDALGAGGVRCTSGYVSAPQCSPTRAGLLTGRYQQRFGHEYNSAIEGSRLPLGETTIATRLQMAGYATGLVGKWHLGDDEAHHPLARGFDEFFGFLGGANPYLPAGPKQVVPRIVRGREPAEEKEFLTAALAREAAAFIERHRQVPFFLYVAFNATHGPLQAPASYLERFAGIADEKRRTYAAMTTALDDAVGTITARLQSAGLLENTLVFFLNDNGGPTDVNASSNHPWRGVKGEVREGGIRIPYFVRWTGTLPAGKTYDQPVIQLDVAPTLLAAAGLEPPADAASDGVNLLPYLRGEKAEPPHAALYWRFNFPSRQTDRHKWAIRQGDWKLFTDLDANRKKRASATASEGIKLVNLTLDPREENDLTSQHPDKAQELRTLWEQWNAQLAPPGGAAGPKNPLPPGEGGGAAAG